MSYRPKGTPVWNRPSLLRSKRSVHLVHHGSIGTGGRPRSCILLVRSEVLIQLSYTSIGAVGESCTPVIRFRKATVYLLAYYRMAERAGFEPARV